MIIRIAYEYVKEYYKDKVAVRSGLPYMNHIDEGLTILDVLGSSEYVKEAYCLHPLLQEDCSFVSMGYRDIKMLDSYVVFLAMEYRAIANNYLPPNFKHGDRKVQISLISGVNQLLTADKIQNYKDYELHQKRDSDLDGYFATWLDALGVTMDSYNKFKEIIS